MGFDENYAPAAVVALFSVLVNTSRRDFEICLFGDNLSKEALVPFSRISAIFNRKMRVVNLDGEKFSGLKVSGHVSRASYARIVAPDSINTDKMFWLDCDTIVHDDISYLLDFKIPDGCIAAGVSDAPVAAERKQSLQLPGSDVYINTGVLLLDANIWRSEKLTIKSLELGKNDPSKFAYWDQCLINKILESRKVLIPDKWNQMYHVYISDFITESNPVDSHFRGILHYTTAEKPWHIWSDRQFARLYKHYASIAPARMPVQYFPEADVQKANMIGRLRRADY